MDEVRRGSEGGEYYRILNTTVADRPVDAVTNAIRQPLQAAGVAAELG